MKDHGHRWRFTGRRAGRDAGPSFATAVGGPAPLLRPALVDSLALLALLTLLVLTLLAPAAHADIVDDSMPPSWTHFWNNAAMNDDDRADAVVIGPGQAIYVAGYTKTSSGYVDATLSKYRGGVSDPTWGATKIWDGPSHKYDSAKAVALGPNGVVHTAGITAGSRAGVMKWSATTGKVLWARSYGSATSECWGEFIGVDRYGNVTTAGRRKVGGVFDWFVASWSPGGSLRWAWRPGALTPGGSGTEPTDLHVTRDGSVYVCGRRDDESAMLTVKLSRRGARLWAKTYKGPEGLGASAMALTPRPGGGVYVCGWTETAATVEDGLVVGYSAAGTRSVFAPHSMAAAQRYHDIEVTSNGSIVAGGTDRSSGFATAHYALFGKTGALINAAGYERVCYDLCQVAVDPHGAFYLATVGYDAATHMRIQVRRVTTICGAGSWASLWQPNATDTNVVGELAVRGLTVVVAGSTQTGGPAQMDQCVAGYIY